MWYTPLTPAPRRRGRRMAASLSPVNSIQSSRLVQASQGYTVRHCLKTNNNGKTSPMLKCTQHCCGSLMEQGAEAPG